jgi:enterochelin esterase family protein
VIPPILENGSREIFCDNIPRSHHQFQENPAMADKAPRARAIVFPVAAALALTVAVAAGQRGQGTAPPPSPLLDGDVTIRPPWSNANELIWDNAVPHGVVHRFDMKSEDSKIYKGLPARAARGRGAAAAPGTAGAGAPAAPPAPPGPIVPYVRPVAVYIPAQYVPGTAAPFIVVQDGFNPKYHLTIPTILDNMIAAKRLPVMLAVLVQHGGGDGPGSERGLEYDTVSDRYTQFIETEVLPKIAKDYKVAFTKDPDGRATMGGSSGAAAAFTMAWFHPELYRRVLSYSGTFVNQQSPVNPESPHGAWEYHATLLPKAEAKPIRVWMEVGGNDNGATATEESFHNWILANRHMAAVLKDKGYHYRFVFAEEARHTDASVILQTLPQALEYVWQGYPIK